MKNDKELVKKQKMLAKEYKKHKALADKALLDSQNYCLKARQTYDLKKSNEYMQLFNKALNDYDYYKNLQALDMKNIQNLHSNASNTPTKNKKEDFGKGYTLIVGG